ncbi:glycosyltransferase, partial [Klebsiella pneumoniae]|nr:glycosyltransferase [Klebsiella pneumoniae]
MKHEIAVSVIIPVYNAEKTIKSLIEDILIEDRINIEVIIVNDGSSDNTSTIINSIKDGRVQVIEQNNKGVYAARNNGLDKHKGQWVMFLDADDDVSEGFIYNRYIQASSHNADVLLSNAWKLWHEGDNKKPVHTNQPYDEVLSGNAWMSHAVKVREWPHYLWLQIVRSDYIRNNNLSFHDGRSHKDILWTMELALANGRFYISKDMDYTYKYNNESITNRGDYFDVRAECYIDVISKTIGHAKSIKNNDLSVSLFRHALYEA